MNNLSRKYLFILPVLLLFFSFLIWANRAPDPNQHIDSAFDGERALNDIKTQLSFGPRFHGSPGHEKMVGWMQTSLESSGWQVEIQTGEMLGHTINNVIAHKGEEFPTIILGAHYDTRLYADKDPDPANLLSPVPGANDGASGVAILLEIARLLPDELPTNIWLVFFDAEDNGHISGWDWILGSQFFVQNIKHPPEVMVLLDMVGDKDLNIFVERNSDPGYTTAIWKAAQQLGYGSYFIPIERYAILDDHIPFIQAGIPAVDIIDFDYPYHHTVADTLDKVSHQSLQVVGETILFWLSEYGK
jgi:glutaminyl-peptide cyclotransferase